MRVTEADEDGNNKKQHELPFNYAKMLPAFDGIDAVQDVEGLVNPGVFIKIDDDQRNPDWPNIRGIGVALAIAPRKPTPVPTGVPRTGFMIESMVTATANNIRATLDGKAAPCGALRLARTLRCPFSMCGHTPSKGRLACTARCRRATSTG